MTMSMDTLREKLGAIEPSEDTYSGIGPDEVPLLVELLGDDEAWLAGRAVYALTRVGSPAALEALTAARSSPRDEVRVALAANASRLPPDAGDVVLQRLLVDPEVGVRKFAIRSVRPENGAAVQERLANLVDQDDHPAIRSLAGERLEILGSAPEGPASVAP